MHEKNNLSATGMAELLDSFVSFEQCGPALAAAVRLNGTDRSVEVLRESTDWSYITRGRPVIDCRTRELSDLVTGPRAVLRAMADLQESSKPRTSMSLR